jgi:hypothetical protein
VTTMSLSAETIDRIRKRLFSPYEPDGTSLFGVVDAARDHRIYHAVRHAGLEYDCLFSGHLEPSLRAAAPYVVRLLPDHALTDYLLGEGWGHSWGIYVAVQGSLPALRRHLRTLLRVETEAGKKLYFRYYDPRVLRHFLPTCSAEQLGQMFGPAHRFDMEAPKPDHLLRFRRTASGVNGALRSSIYALDGSSDRIARDD